MFKFLKDIVLKFAAGQAIDSVIDLLDEWLEKFYAQKPKTCAALVSGFYIGIDGFLEDLVAKTKTDIDDKAVAALKAEIEKFAAAHNIELIDLDGVETEDASPGGDHPDTPPNP